MSSHCGQFDSGLTRRDWLSRLGLGVGGMALASLLGQECVAANANPFQGILDQPHHPPKAKRIIYLFMSGGPSQLDLFDYKPLLEKMHGENLPESVRMGQRLTGMSANQATFPLVKCPWKFAQHGESVLGSANSCPGRQRWSTSWPGYTAVTPNTSITTRRSLFFKPVRHLAGRPSMGSWLSYGLGSANENLPAFVVLISKDRIDQPLYARLWGNGFLPSIHQGVQFRSGKDPVLYLANPAGVTAESRRKMLDRLAELQCRTVRRSRRSGDQQPRGSVRNGVPHADQCARGDGSFQRTGKHVRTIWSRGQDAGNVCGELLARTAAGRARRAVHSALSSRLGSSRKLAEGDYQGVQRRRSGQLCARHRFGAARTLEGYACRMGWRVRPNQLLPGQTRRRTILAATIIRAASRCGWPAAA